MRASGQPAGIARALRRLALLAVLPLLALILAFHYTAYHEARIDAEARMLNQAEQVAAEVTAFMHQTERALNQVAKRPAVQRMDPAQCDPNLKDLIQIQPSFVNIGQTDRDGWLICASTPPPAGPRSINVATDAFKAVMAGKRFALGAVRPGPLSGQWIVAAMVPVLDARGEILGVAVATVDLVGWWEHRGLARLAPEIVLGAFEKDGRIVLRTPQAREWVGRDASQQALTAEMLRVGHGTFAAPGVQGFERIWAVAPIARTNWIAFAGIQTDVVFEKSRQQALLALSLIMLVLLATAWALVRTGRSLAQPIEDLSATAARIAGGETDLRANASGPAEIQAVAQQFNRVLDARDANEARLRDLASLTGDWFWETDAEHRYTWFSGNLKEQVGRDPAFYTGRTRMEVAQAEGEDLSAEPLKSHLETLAGHKPFRNFVSYRVMPTGGYWLSVSGVPIFAPDGGFLGYRGATANITRQVLADREAQRTLAQSEARFRTLVESAPEAIVVRDSQTLLYANPAAVRMIGARSKEDLVGRPFIDMVDPEDREAVTARNEALFNSGDLSPIEARLIRFDGTTIAVSAQASRIIYEGRTAIFVSMRDVTEVRRAQNLVAATVRRYQDILSILYGAILLFGEDGKAEYANQGYCDLFGLRQSPEDLVGMPSSEMLRMIEDRYAEPAASMARIRALIVAGQPVRDEEIRLRDGRTCVRDFVPIAIDGVRSGRLWFHREVTEQHRLHDSIREMKDRLGAVIDASMDAIVSVDEDERVVVFSKAAEQLFGLPAAQALGQSLERFIPARHRAGHHAHMREFKQSRTTVRATGQFIQLSAVRADGAEFPIEASISHVVVGERHLLTVTMRDLTQRAEAEAHRASLEAQLREAQKMAAIGTLAGGIAHDFNNILATILGNVELARQDAGADEQVLESLGEIRKAGARARDLVQQILSFSRRQPVERKRIDLASVAEEAARLLRATLPARVSLDLTCAPDTPAVLADATQMQQVLINLATNAMQAIGESSGRIGIRLDGVRVDAAGKVRLKVTDTGPGMDAAVRERIFEPFFTTKAVNKGTGLGLSVVHGIVHAHDGSIEVESAPGRGTSFTILLPAARAEAGPARAAPASGGAAPGTAGLGQQILYVDDDRALVSLFKRLLERRGYRVSAHTDPHEALAALRADPAAFDLVVTDYNMPGLSGLDVARKVRAIRADLPVAVASGFVDESLRARAAAAGVLDIVFKATEVDAYCAAVQRLLDANRGASR